MTGRTIYLAYRDGDSSGLAATLREELGRTARLVSADADAGGPMPPLPPDGTVLVLVGTRWLRPAPGGRDQISDALAGVLRSALAAGTPVVPVLFGVPLRDWGSLCDELPPGIGGPLRELTATELRLQTFDADLGDLAATVLADRADGPWTDIPSRAVIEVRAARGGALKWYSNRDKAIRVFVDGTEIGVLTAWAGRLSRTVEPGEHTVQVREGSRFGRRSGITLHVGTDAPATLVCERNILTGALQLEQAG